MSTAELFEEEQRSTVDWWLMVVGVVIATDDTLQLHYGLRTVYRYY
jgi:hypothetical protein